jgi:hypothetical protein
MDSRGPSTTACGQRRGRLCSGSGRSPMKAELTPSVPLRSLSHTSWSGADDPYPAYRRHSQRRVPGQLAQARQTSRAADRLQKQAPEGASEFRLLFFVLGEHQQLPSDRTNARRMLVVPLRGEGVTGRDTDLVAACRASIDAGERSRDSWLVVGVESRILGLVQVLTVLVQSHVGSLRKVVPVTDSRGPLALTVMHRRINYPRTGLHTPYAGRWVNLMSCCSSASRGLSFLLAQVH